MSFLSRLFGAKGGSAEPEGKLLERLERMEAEAATAPPAYVGSVYNRAGDVALGASDRERALGYYRRAIDAFLGDAQREAARAVANKIVRIMPGAVRTRCTLTWLDLASRHTATALLHMRDYVASASREPDLAAHQIFAMARIVPDPDFLAAVADALVGLGFPQQAKEVRGWVEQHGSPDAITDAEELANTCLMAAVRSNERRRSGRGEDDGSRTAASEPSSRRPEEGRPQRR